MEEYVRYWAEHPSTMSIGRASGVGRVALDRTIQQIEDVLDDPEYGRQDLQAVAGFRTLLSAPMIVDDEVVGVLAVWRTTVVPFDDRAVELLGVFAAQAAIVVENVGLVQALESRSAELATKVDQLEALREVGEAVSSSLDLAGGARADRRERRTADRHRRRLDHGVRRAGGLLRGAQRVRQQRPSCSTACGASRSARESTLVGRAALDRRPAGGGRPVHGAPRPAPADSCTTTGGARCSRCRCRARTRSSAPW